VAEPKDDGLGCLLVGAVAGFLALILFLFLVVVPDGQRQIRECEERGGVKIHGACVDKSLIR
jgi:hypothetical protein